MVAVGMVVGVVVVLVRIGGVERCAGEGGGVKGGGDRGGGALGLFRPG